MYKDRRIGVVVPSHNEAAHIREVIQTMPGFVDHIIVVDDCSTAETSGAAKQSGDDRVLVIRTQSNSGVGGATIIGYKQGLEINCDVLVKMDGDGQMPPEYLANLLHPIVDDGFDYAKGNRFLAGESLASMPKH